MQRTCDIEGCTNAHKARGWCDPHYRRWKRHGDPLTSRPPRRRHPSPRMRWDKVAFLHPAGCWLWRGRPDRHGYGRIGWRIEDGKKETGAHRVAYMRLIGEIPDGLTLDHLCRNKLCVNPLHMEPVTARENVRRGYPGRRPRRGLGTVCKYGHMLTAENLYVTPAGYATCRECNRQRCRAYKERRRTPTLDATRA